MRATRWVIGCALGRPHPTLEAPGGDLSHAPERAAHDPDTSYHSTIANRRVPVPQPNGPLTGRLTAQVGPARLSVSKPIRKRRHPQSSEKETAH